MVSEQLINFLQRLKETDMRGSTTSPQLKKAARHFLGNRKHYEEYETFIFEWGEIDVHDALLSLLYDNI